MADMVRHMRKQNYRLMGRSGLRISEVCLGTMTFGDSWGWGASEEESRKIYDSFREAGGNFLDTANIYTSGESEKFVGRFIRDHRAEMVVSTKYSISAFASKTSPNPNSGGNHRKNMIESVEQSLKRLGTDYIDLYWVHAWDQMTPAEEVMRALDDLIRSGKVLYVGVSNTPAWQVAKGNTLAELRGWTRYVGMQVEYNLLQREVERELVPMAREEDMTLVAWSPLRNGYLTGKYLPERNGAAKGSRFTLDFVRDAFPVNAFQLRVVREVVKVAESIDATPAQVALAWLLHRGVPIIPIIGAKSLNQFQDNMRFMELELSQEHLASLDDISAIPMGYPMDFLNGGPMQQSVFASLRNQILA